MGDRMARYRPPSPYKGNEPRRIHPNRRYRKGCRVYKQSVYPIMRESKSYTLYDVTTQQCRYREVKMETIKGHRAAVEYRFNLRDILMALTGTVLYMLLVFGALASM